jgi:NifB/MoaA-like Fe-S oxidoreductase
MDQYLRRARPGVLRGTGGTLACGTLIAPRMAEAIDKFNAYTGAELQVRGIDNNYLGTEINVSGLLCGGDIIEQLKDEPSNGPIFVTKKMISDRTGTLLDDMRIEEVSSALGRPIQPNDTMAEVAAYLRRRRPALQVA